MRHMQFKKLYIPQKGKPMNIIVFASGGGGNLKASIDLSLARPDLLKVGLVVTDRLGIFAIDIAHKYQIPVIAIDFEKKCGSWNENKKNPEKILRYQQCAIQYHDDILKRIRKIEEKSAVYFDLVVLSYHRWIHGDLYTYFHERMINQHAGDLSIVNDQNVRQYVGINPVLYALQAGEKKTRTTTFLVRDGHDTGEILCQGPWVDYAGSYPITVQKSYEHELIQKKESDWPSLQFALKNIAQGNFGISKKHMHIDGCKVILFKGKPTGYAGINLEESIYKLTPYHE